MFLILESVIHFDRVQFELIEMIKTLLTLMKLQGDQESVIWEKFKARGEGAIVPSSFRNVKMELAKNEFQVSANFGKGLVVSVSLLKPYIAISIYQFKCYQLVKSHTQLMFIIT